MDSGLRVRSTGHAPREIKLWNRSVQVHGFFSKGFVKTDANNWLTMYTSQGNGALTDMGLNLSSQADQGSGERKLVTRGEPEYPGPVKMLKIGGTVRLSVTNWPKGTVEKVVVLGGNPILAEAAAKAARQWVYMPAASQTVKEVAIPF